MISRGFQRGAVGAEILAAFALLVALTTLSCGHYAYRVPIDQLTQRRVFDGPVTLRTSDGAVDVRSLGTVTLANGTTYTAHSGATFGAERLRSPTVVVRSTEITHAPLYGALGLGIPGFLVGGAFGVLAAGETGANDTGTYVGSALLVGVALGTLTSLVGFAIGAIVGAVDTSVHDATIVAPPTQAPALVDH